MRKTILINLILFCAVAQAQNSLTAIDSMITTAHRLGVFNGNVVVIDHERELYRCATGVADVVTETPLTDQYRFHIGSIAKEFNAVAIMMLQEQGKLQLTDNISKHLPGLPAWSKTITIQHLLQYSSGLPNLPWKNISSTNAAMDSLNKIQQLDFSPGTQYAYNNTNTLLQRQIVARISGMRFSDFVYTHMLQPLGMNASVVDPTDSTPLMAHSFNNKKQAARLAAPIEGWTAVTLDDFVTWQRSLEQFRLISPASTQILLTPFTPHKQCGLGGGTMVSNQLIQHTHDGTSLQYQALLMANKPAGRIIILLTNNRQNNLYDIAGAIQAILAGKPYVQPKKSVMSALEELIDTTSGHGLLKAYQQLKQEHAAEYTFDQESVLNSIGYILLNKKKTDDAIVIFQYNTTLFPYSGNVFDSLGEAYYIKGDKNNALLHYRHALELDTTNEGAWQKVAELESK